MTAGARRSGGLLLLAVLPLVFGGAGRAAAESPLLAFLHLERPGVHAVRPSDLRSAGLEVEDLHRVRLRFEDRTLGVRLRPSPRTGEPELLFLAESAWFGPSSPQRAVEPVAVGLHALPEGSEGFREAGEPVGSGPAGGESRPPSRVVTRLVHLERDEIRVPWDGPATPAGTWWHWAMLTPLESSSLQIDLGPTLEGGGPGTLRVDVRMLGFSRAFVPESVPWHRVEASVDGAMVGAAEWNGRESASLSFEIPWNRGEGSDPILTLRVPARVHEGDTLVDLVYVDDVVIRLPAASPLGASEAPVEIPALSESFWLADPSGDPADLLFVSGGRILDRDSGGWIVPATAQPAEGWILAGATAPRSPRIEPVTTTPAVVPDEVDHLLLAPGFAVAEVERLADVHRRRGLAAAVVDLDSVWQHDGRGKRTPEVLRDFLAKLARRAHPPGFVLLVGDADWFADSGGPSDGGLVPTWTFVARHGSGASDHPYAADPENPARPLFALGRLPARSAEEVRDYVDGVERGLEVPPAPRPTLLLSDESGPSRARRRRLARALESCVGGLLREPADSPETIAPDRAVLDLVAREEPGLVVFGGHGAARTWQVGSPETLAPESFLDAEELEGLPALNPAPVVVAISCGTAPFDHPGALSLAEAFVLAGDRGASAYIGSSAMLATPERFTRDLVRLLLSEPTIGEAFVAAKTRLGREEVSALYGLFGDPALPPTVASGSPCFEEASRTPKSAPSETRTGLERRRRPSVETDSR